MDRIKWILFDCMETIIDMTEIPGLEDYARWSYLNSGVEYFWDGFADFFQDFCAARQAIAGELPEFKEYEIYYQFKLIAAMKIENDWLIEQIARKLRNNYWQLYLARSYVQEEIRGVLGYLAGKYSLGVVSNFMYQGGVEKLLEINNIFKYFSFVITSVNEGWRKPHPTIFKRAVARTGVLPEEILFIGDNYQCDYLGPREVGLKVLYYDKNRRKLELAERIENLVGLRLLL